jgi:hypothetical protein
MQQGIDVDQGTKPELIIRAPTDKSIGSKHPAKFEPMDLSVGRFNQQDLN